MKLPLIKPPALRRGDTVGIFAPSTPAHVLFPEKYRHGVSVLRSLGFEVIEGSLMASGATQGYRAGSPRERAAELMELVLDPSVRCIFSAIGGYNSSSLIPYLDFDAIRANPKIICGYSDITMLHLAILAHAGLRTFYGPAVMPSFGEWPTILPETLDSFLDATMNHRSGSRRLTPPPRWSNHWRDARTEWNVVPRRFEENPGWRALVPGAASAPVVVANLNTLCATAGTPEFPELDGTILLIEEMAAPMTVEERSLRHLDRLGVFDRIAGLIVGKPEIPDTMGAPFSLDDLILEIVGAGRSYPMVTGFDCSHTVPMLTLAEMTPITLTAGEGFDVTVVIDEPMVEEREDRVSGLGDRVSEG